MNESNPLKYDRKLLTAMIFDASKTKNQEKNALNGLTSASFDLEALSASADVESRLQQVEQVLLKLQQPLQCSICLDLLSNPVSTKCGHSFCTLCIHRLLQGVRGPSSCPLCLAPVTKRSLEKNDRISQLVLAVRGIIDGIKKDCGLINSPNKSRATAAARPAVEDNSDEEEMDEPRRGTRNRMAVPDYSEMAPLLEEGGGYRGVRRGRNRGGAALLPVRNVSAPDLLSLEKNSGNDGRRFSKPVPLKDSSQVMMRSAADLTTSNPDHPKTLEALAKPANGTPGAAGIRGRGRFRGGGRGRGRPSSAKSLGPSTMSSEEELVSVSQVKLPPSSAVDGAKNVSSNHKEIKEVESLKPKDKVSLWLNESSTVGFKVGLSQAAEAKQPSVSPKITNPNESHSKSVPKKTPIPKEKDNDVVPSGDNVGNVFALPVIRKCDKNTKEQFSDQLTGKLRATSAGTSSIVDPLDAIAKVTTDKNKICSAVPIDLMEDDELPDINNTSELDEFAESTPRESSKERVLVGRIVDVSAISANDFTDEEDEGLDVLPDSCPVNTKDLFDVLVETARKIPPPTSVNLDSQKDETTAADDVYFFCTPAEGNVQDVASKKCNVVKSKVSKKRMLECPQEQNDFIKRSRAPIQSSVGKNLNPENVSPSSVGKKEDSKVLKYIAETENRNSKLSSKSSSSTTRKGNLKSLKSSAASVNLLAISSEGDGESAALVASCEAMPPPAAPDPSVQLRDRKARATCTEGRGAVGASKSAKTRYASELKKRFTEPPKLMATSLCVKDFKSPGWSHVVGAKKDLKSRHIGLNITGGDVKQDLSRLDRTADPVKGMTDNSKHCAGDNFRLASSGESSVEIDDQTQKFDVEHLEGAPEELEKISKLKILVHQLTTENFHDGYNSEGKKSVERSNTCSAPEKSKEQQETGEAKMKEESPVFTTVIPETQSNSAKSFGDSEEGLLSDSEVCLGNPPPLDPLEADSSSKAPFVRQLGSRKPVAPKTTAKKSKAKLIPYSSSENSIPATSIPEVQPISESSSLQKSKNEESEEAVPNANNIKQNKKSGVLNAEHNVDVMETIEKVISDSSTDQALVSLNPDVPEDQRSNVAPARRVMRSGRLRRDIPSSVSSSSVLEKVKAKQSKTKTNVGSGEEKENVDVEGVPRSPRSLTEMQKRSKSSADLSVTAASYSTISERAKLRSSLRSANLQVAPSLLLLPKRTTHRATMQEDDAAVLDEMIGEVLQANVDKSGMEVQNRTSSAFDTCNLENLENNFKNTQKSSNINSTQAVCSSVQSGMQMSSTTGYCFTEATKFTNLETSSASLLSDALAPSVEIRVNPKNTASHQVSAVNDPVVIPCSSATNLMSSRKLISSEDSQGLEFEERTIVPTVFKNKRLQADLLSPCCNAATQTSDSCAELASVAIQCDLGAERVRHFNMQTEVIGKEVSVQVQLAPEGSLVAGVIPFGAVGDSCSDRCVGPLEALRKAAGEQKQCLHAVPCALYQTLLSMLHLVPAQPLSCCGHKTPVGETSKAGGSSNADANSNSEVASNVSPDPGLLATKADQGPNSVSALSSSSSTSENASVHLACDAQDVPAAPVATPSSAVELAARRRGRRKQDVTASRTEKPSKALKVKDKKGVSSSSLKMHSSTESNSESLQLGDSKANDAASDLKLPVSNEEPLGDSARTTMSDTLLVDANQDTKTEQTFKEHLMQNLNSGKAFQTQMSTEIPFLGGVNIQPRVLLEDCTSPGRQFNLQSKRLSMTTSEFSLNKNSKLTVPSDDSDLFKTNSLSRITRQRTKVVEKPASQSDLFASGDVQSCAADAVSQDSCEKSSRVGGTPTSKLAKKQKVMNDAQASGKLSSDEKKGTVSSNESNIGKTKDDCKLGSPLPSFSAEPKMSELDFSKNVGRRKFKRIRSLDGGDSSSDEEPSKKKPALRKNKITTVVFGASEPKEDLRNVSAHEKNSEELRLEKYDDGVLKYFGYHNEEVLDTALKNNDYKIDSSIKKSADLPDINTFSEMFEEESEMAKAKDDSKSDLESDDEDCIPGTAEVLKNIAVDAALIQSVRDKQKFKGSVVNSSDLLTQETVVISSSVESCADIIQNDIVPSSILRDEEGAISLPGSGNVNSYGLKRKATCDRDNTCRSGAADSHDSCPSGTTDAGLTDTAQRLFTKCDRSLRRVERALRSQDSTVSSSVLNTGSERLPKKTSASSSAADLSDGMEHLLRSASSFERMKSRNDRSSTSTTSSGAELPDKGDETTEDFGHFSMMSTQSEGISTQYRNKVQSEVEMLQAKKAALQEQLSCLKQAPSLAAQSPKVVAGGRDAMQSSDGGQRVTQEKPVETIENDLDGENDLGHKSAPGHGVNAVNIEKSAPHLTVGRISASTDVKSSNSRSTAQSSASDGAGDSGASQLRSTRASASRLSGRGDRKMQAKNCVDNKTETTARVPSNDRLETDDQDLFESLPSPNCNVVVPNNEEAAENLSSRSVTKKDESRRGGALESVRKRSVLVCTGLSAAETLSVYKLVKSVQRPGDPDPAADMPLVELLKAWAPSVTHVIVKCGEDRTTERTLKYLYGVASGCWVVSFEWARQCLTEGRLLDESGFEALDSTGYPGPERGRRLRGQLLAGCVVCCAPPFRDVSRHQLHELVQLCGGQVVEDAAQLKAHELLPSAAGEGTSKHQLQLIIVHTDEEDEHAKKLAEDLSERHGRAVVASDWLIESVAMYSLVALSPYLLSPPHEHVLKASGISLELLQETQELI